MTLSVPYAVASLPTGVTEGSLRLLRYDVATGAWMLVPALPVYEANDLAQANLDAFGNEYFMVAAQVPANSLTDFEVLPAEVPADGASFSTVTVIPRDSEGRVIGPGLTVVVSITGSATLGPVQDVGNGVYRALVTSSTPGVVTVNATVGGQAVVKDPPVEILFLNPRPATFTIEFPPGLIRAGESQTPTIKARKGDDSVETTFVGVVRLDITGTRLVSSAIEFPGTLYAVFSRRHEGILTLEDAVTFIQAGPQTVTATLMVTSQALPERRPSARLAS